jgi:hypothetical protein
MNDILTNELKRFTVVKSLDEETLNKISQEYKNLTDDEQYILSFLWTIEEMLHKNKLRNEGKSSKDIRKEDTCLHKLMKVENIK